MRSLTGLSPEEFEALLPNFERAYDAFVRSRFINRPDRKRAYGGGRKPRLGSASLRLLFILFYFRVYPTQEVQGFFFGLSQEQAHEWIHRLTPVLNEALGYEMALPERRAYRLEEALREVPVLEVLTEESGGSEDASGPTVFIDATERPIRIDATERPIRRPKDLERQRTFYSGKKKRHTVKNVVVTDARRRVLYLSRTCEGKRSDKRSADEEDYHFPPGTVLYQDKGFQGYAPPGVGETRQPKKKPRGGQLTDEEKAANSLINRVRVRVEHAIGGVKISQIVSSGTFRNYRQGFEDAVMETACGLQNFRCDQRAAAATLAAEQQLTEALLSG